MKNKQIEKCRRQMRDFHRHHQWRLENGLYFTRDYTDSAELSWSDEFGFILNGRRVIVHWCHPRTKYVEAINEAAWREVGGIPETPFEWHKMTWKRTGKSRKKIDSYQVEFDQTELARFAQQHTVEERMKRDGIEYYVYPSFVARSTPRAISIDICMPVEINSRNDAIAVAFLVKDILNKKEEFRSKFLNYRYDIDTWKNEQSTRSYQLP